MNNVSHSYLNSCKDSETFKFHNLFEIFFYEIRIKDAYLLTYSFIFSFKNDHNYLHILHKRNARNASKYNLQLLFLKNLFMI